MNKMNRNALKNHCISKYVSKIIKEEIKVSYVRNN